MVKEHIKEGNTLNLFQMSLEFPPFNTVFKLACISSSPCSNSKARQKGGWTQDKRVPNMFFGEVRIVIIWSRESENFCEQDSEIDITEISELIGYPQRNFQRNDVTAKDLFCSRWKSR